MTKAQDFAARANLVSVPADAEPKPDAAAPAVRLAPVKMTVELDHAAYQFVRNFPDVMGIPAAVGKVRVPTVEVFRALLEELDQDPELAARIAARIKANVS
jgi:hypothetical protein